MPRPPPPATALISTGKPTEWAKVERLLLVAHDAVAAGHDRHVGLARQRPSRVFVAQPGHRLRAGADEVDVAAAADFVEVGVFGEEAVAGMNRLHVADFGGADHAGDFEIAVGRFGRADAIGFVRQLQIMGTAVAFAVDRHGLDAQLPARADDPQRDLTPVGNKNSLVHGDLCRFGFQPDSSGSVSGWKV